MGGIFQSGERISHPFPWQIEQSISQKLTNSCQMMVFSGILFGCKSAAIFLTNKGVMFPWSVNRCVTIICPLKTR